jgi:hypothetical protein
MQNLHVRPEHASLPKNQHVRPEYVHVVHLLQAKKMPVYISPTKCKHLLIHPKMRLHFFRRKYLHIAKYTEPYQQYKNKEKHANMRYTDLKEQVI